MAEVEDSLPELFRAVSRKLRELSRATLAPWDIAPSHARALGTLDAHGPMRLSELSDWLRIAARSTTEVVDALEQRGLAVRVPDAQDRRATLVELTDEGRRAADSIRVARAADAEAYFGSLSATDRANLVRILHKLGD